MTNYLQPGETILVKAPADTLSGDLTTLGLLVGVATGDAVAGTDLEICTRGIFRLPKTATDTIGVGDRLFWDAATKRLTNTRSVDAKQLVAIAHTAAINGTSTIDAILTMAGAEFENLTRGYLRVGGAGDVPIDLDARAAGRLLIGDGTDIKSVAVSGDVSLAASGAARVLKLGVPANGTVIAHSASGNIGTDVDKIHTNTGAGGGIVLALPMLAGNAGKFLKFQLTAAQTVTITPQAGDSIFLGGSGVASKSAIIAGVIGNYVDLACDGARWLMLAYNGVVTKEP